MHQDLRQDLRQDRPIAMAVMARTFDRRLGLLEPDFLAIF
jgi:hypothetical protein